MVNWQNIHQNFTPELQKEWEGKGFSYEQTWHWAQVFGNNFNPNDYNFFNWLVNENSTELIRSNDDYLADNNKECQAKKQKVNWQEYGNPFLDFTEEVTQQWIRAGFTRMQTRGWLSIGLRATDANHAWWLRDIVHETPESILDHGNDEKLREQYQEYLQSLRNSSNEEKDEGALLARAINSLLEAEENARWEIIHPNFTPELRREWESKWFTYEEVKEWVDNGGEIYDVEHALLLKEERSRNGNVLSLIKKVKVVKSKNAQEWLNKNFPKKQRSNYVELDISNRNLEGELDLSDFTNLQELDCSSNNIFGLSLGNSAKNLKILDCPNNQLTDLDLSACRSLEFLRCCPGNQLKVLDLSNCSSLKQCIYPNYVYVIWPPHIAKKYSEEESEKNNFSEQEEDISRDQKERLNREIVQQKVKLQETIKHLEKEENILQKQLERAVKSNNPQIIQKLQEKLEVKRKEIAEIQERLEKENRWLDISGSQMIMEIDKLDQMESQIQFPPK